MIIDMNYWTKVIRKILIFLFSIFGVYLAFKLAIFYMPFLVAFIISQIIEPIIRFCMKHFKWKRRISAIVVFIIVLGLLIGILVSGIVTLISETSNFLGGLNGYIEKVSNQFNNLTAKIDLAKLNVPREIVTTLQDAGNDLFELIGTTIKNFLTGLLNIITSLPSVIIYTVISILSLYFICTDKIYMIDQLEHHFPEIWVKKVSKHIKEITKSLGQYLKAQAILVFVSFLVCLIGLYILKFTGLNIEYPLLAALGIGFVDALPIFGSSAVMIPWAIIRAFNGEITLAICLIVLLIVMSITKQLIEPKVVSRSNWYTSYFYTNCDVYRI